MTITRQYDEFRVICDVCGEQLDDEAVFDTFDDARESALNEGWKARKKANGTWENICPSCQ